MKLISGETNVPRRIQWICFTFLLLYEIWLRTMVVFVSGNSTWTRIQRGT
jgi:hypothetical protein